MSAIWKFPVPYGIDGAGPVRMPQGAQILSVQMQDGRPQLWALVDTDKPMVQRDIAVYGTGWDISNPGKYLGTFQDGQYVFHAFDRTVEA